MASSSVAATGVPTRAERVEALPHRRLYVVAAVVIAAVGALGTAQLVTGTFTPPVSALDPLGLTSWVLPGLWLFASVVVPWSVAAWAAARRWPEAPVTVLIAAGLLLVELAVQIPFLGFSPFQPVMGAAAIGLGATARHDQARWRS